MNAIAESTAQFSFPNTDNQINYLADYLEAQRIARELLDLPAERRHLDAFSRHVAEQNEKIISLQALVVSQAETIEILRAQICQLMGGPRA